MSQQQQMPAWMQRFSGNRAGNITGSAYVPPPPSPGQQGQMGGQVWNGTAWVPRGQGGAQGQPYTAPFQFPRSTREWEENILTNPAYLQKAGENPLGLNAALLYSIMGQREANEATDKDFKEAQGILYRNRDYTRGLLEDSGKQAEEDFGRSIQQQRGGSDQDLINRGLYNTTVQNQVQNRLTETEGRGKAAIKREGAGQRANNENLYAQLLSGLSGQRQRIFSPGVYGNLAQAASTPTGPGKTATIIGGASGILGSLLGGLFA